MKSAQVASVGLLLVLFLAGCSGGSGRERDTVGVSVDSKAVGTFKNQDAAVAKASELAGFRVLAAEDLPKDSSVTGVNVVRSGIAAGAQILVSNSRGGLLIEELQGQPIDAGEPWAVAGGEGEYSKAASPGVQVYSVHRNGRVFVITTHSETALSEEEAAAILKAFAKAV